MSYKQYLSLRLRLRELNESLRGWYPDIDDAMKLTEFPIENYKFILWLVIKGEEVSLDGEQLTAFQILKEAIKDITKIVVEDEDEDETAGTSKTGAKSKKQKKGKNGAKAKAKAGTKAKAKAGQQPKLRLAKNQKLKQK